MKSKMKHTTHCRVWNDFNDDDIAIMARQASRFRVGYTRIQSVKLDPENDSTLAKHGVRFAKGQVVYVAVDFDAYERLCDLDIPAIQPIEISDNGHLTLTPSQAFRFGIYRNENAEDFAEIPRIYESEQWTCFQQLKAFAERYTRAEDAPIWYESDVLHWVNAPVLHSRVKHLVCMSATLQRDGFERAFDSERVTFIENPPTHFVDGHRAFQVRSGKYPRATLLEREHGMFGKVTGLKKTGKYFLNLIENEIHTRSECQIRHYHMGRNRQYVPRRTDKEALEPYQRAFLSPDGRFRL